MFRAWSHYAALSGSKHLEFLVGKNLVTPKPSKILDELYAGDRKPFENGTSNPAIEFPDGNAEQMVLRAEDHKRFADTLEFPELSIELSRAVWQVEKALKARDEEKRERVEQEKEKEKEKEREEKKSK